MLFCSVIEIERQSKREHDVGPLLISFGGIQMISKEGPHREKKTILVRNAIVSKFSANLEPASLGCRRLKVVGGAISSIQCGKESHTERQLVFIIGVSFCFLPGIAWTLDEDFGKHLWCSMTKWFSLDM